MTEYFDRKRTDPIPEVNGSILSEYSIGDAKLTMWIPSEHAGKIIGKKGTVISHIQRETKSRLINAMPTVGESLWMAVAIVGDWSSITSAYNAISDMVFGEVDDVVYEFMINYRRPFFLFGRYQHDAVKYISAMSSVRILVPEFDSQVQKFSEATPVTLEGTFENVKKAIALFEQEAVHYVERQKERRRDNNTEREKLKSRAIAKVVEIERRPLPRPVGPLAIAATSIESSTQPVAPCSSSSLHPNNTLADKRVNRRPERTKEPLPVPPAAAVVVEKKEPVVEVVEPPKVKITRSIEVPSNIAGLLLNRRHIGLRTMDTIQRNTRTIISKSLTVAKAADVSSSAAVDENEREAAPDAAKKAAEVVVDGDNDGEGEDEEEATEDTKDRRRRRAENDEDDDGEEEEDDDSESEDDEGSESEEKDEEETEHVAAKVEAIFDQIEKGAEGICVDNSPKEAVSESSEPLAAAATKPERVKKVYSTDPVLLHISGEQAHVDLAYDTLMRIIKGERIKDVLSAMARVPPSSKRPKERPARGTAKPREKFPKRDPAIGKRERALKGKRGSPATADDTAKASSNGDNWQRSVPLPDDKKPATADEAVTTAPVGERGGRGRGGRGRGRGRSSGRGGGGRGGGGRVGSKYTEAAAGPTSTE